MAQKESLELAAERWKKLELLQEHYTSFPDFLYDGITELMGYNCTAIQLDIAAFMEAPFPKNKMVQAQRSQAKTTIASFFAVFRLIHDPTYRVLIFSAGSAMSSQISKWIIQIIMHWDILECLRPDTQAGDRSGVDAFDIHHSLKGPEKSPSIACLGIGSNMQGYRADLIIPDDVESGKNSLTQVQRDKLLQQTRDFASICQNGEILWLGTPQTGDSIYNTLPGRGVLVRVWPGRYPTAEELPGYGNTLAPMILNAIKEDPSLQTGGGPTLTRGKPTDPELLNEEQLTAKEIDQGPSYFQLQHMLCTELSDQERYPLKLRNLVAYPIDLEQGPGKIIWSPTPENLVPRAAQSAVQSDIYRGILASNQFFDYTHKIMYVDPAGGGANGDETAYVVLYLLHGYIFLVDFGAFPGGYGDTVYEGLSTVYHEFNVRLAYVEENYGKGAFAKLWRQYDSSISIEDVYEHGQKELRIIDTLEPVISRHRLIINEHLLQKDVDLCKRYPAEHRSVFQLFFQLEKITRDKACLIHEDRLDALAGGVRQLMMGMEISEDKAIDKRNQEMLLKWLRDPLGTGINAFGLPEATGPNMLSRIKRGNHASNRSTTRPLQRTKRY